MKKRIIVLILIFAMALSMTACSSILGSVLNKGKPSSKPDVDDMLSNLEDMLEDMDDDFVEHIPATEAPAVEAPAEEFWPSESYALEDYIYGTWRRETMYLEFYGCDAVMYTTFQKDGRASQVLVRADNGDLLNESAGDWSFNGDGVYLIKDGETGRITFTYNEFTHQLKNGDRLYTKID